MKKMNNLQMEGLQGGKCGTGTSAFAGMVCAAAVLTGPLGLLMYGPSCGALAYSCL